MRNRIFRRSLVLLGTVVLASTAAARENRGGKHEISALKIENGAVRLDGVLDEPDWQRALESE